MNFVQEEYNYAARYYALHLIPDRRRDLVLGVEEKAGNRFNTDQQVLTALESHFTDSQFGSDPDKYIDLALHYCAQADYHYDNKYEYEGEECEVDDDDD